MTCLLRTVLVSIVMLLLATTGAGGARADDLYGSKPAAPRLVTAPSARYVVQLVDEPLATYTGTVPGLTATAIGSPRDAARDRSDEMDDGDQAPPAGEDPVPPAGEVGRAAPSGGRARLALDTPAAIAYRDYLRGRHAALERALDGIAPGVAAQYHYTTLVNGIVVRLTPDQAEAVRALPGVLAVHQEERIELRMDSSRPLIGVPAAWTDPRIGGGDEAGRGVRIAIIDSGVAPDHPMFEEEGFTVPDGFPRASLTIGDDVHDYDPTETAGFTNRKLIVARYYVNPEAFEASPDMPRDPLPAFSFHGSHVAGIAAGRQVSGGPNMHGRGDIEFSGVAPGAHLMAYRFDEAYTPEMVRAIEDAVADGADVINNSWGTALMNVISPETHPISQAFKAAAAANVVVVAAAGNSGDLGEATLGGAHQMIEEVITVGNSQTGRTLHSMVRAEDEGLPESLRAHESFYIDNGPAGPAWDEYRAIGKQADACADDPAELEGYILLIGFMSECEGYTPDLPPGIDPEIAEIIPDYVLQTMAALDAGAHAVVFHFSEDDPFLLFLLILWEIIKVLVPELSDLKAVPAFLLFGDEAEQLADWSETHDTLEILLDITPDARVDAAAVDMAEPSTSQGPAPADPRLPLKPDLSAPGTDILSANAVGGRAAGYVLATGTSMSSPTVSGAAALVRQAWPDWTPAQVRSALMITTDPVVKTSFSSERAPVDTQGAGRLRVDRALDPGALLDPPSLNLGWRRGGQATFEITARDVRLDPAGDAIYAVRHEPAGPGDAPIVDLPDSVTVPSGGEASFSSTFDLERLAPGAYGGRIVLESSAHSVHIVYSVHVPDERKDVLLVNTLASYEVVDEESGDSEILDLDDYAAYWTSALEEAELSYEVWTVAGDTISFPDAEDGMPPLSELQRFDLAILAGGDGNLPLEGMSRGMTPMQMYLLGGGAMFISGHRMPNGPRDVPGNGAQSAGRMSLLGRYFAGFELIEDDAEGLGPFDPARLFDRPVLLESGEEDAADNGGLVDLGRPLEMLVTAAREGFPSPPDTAWSTPATRIMPYAKSYLETSEGASVLTGVTRDATLETPSISPDITWRAMHASFPVEAVAGSRDGHLSRAELLQQVYLWATEPEDVELTLAGPPVAATGAPARFSVTADLPDGFSGARRYRWDAGADGGGIRTTDVPEVDVRYRTPGAHTMRVEMESWAGRTFVATTTVEVEGAIEVYLPAVKREVGPSD